MNTLLRTALAMIFVLCFRFIDAQVDSTDHSYLRLKSKTISFLSAIGQTGIWFGTRINSRHRSGLEVAGWMRHIYPGPYPVNQKIKSSWMRYFKCPCIYTFGSTSKRYVTRDRPYAGLYLPGDCWHIQWFYKVPVSTGVRYRNDRVYNITR